MTNVYEALQRARKERDDAERISPVAAGGRDIRQFSPAIEVPSDVPAGSREIRAAPFRDTKGISPPGEASGTGDMQDSDGLVPIVADASLRYHFSEMVALLSAIRSVLDSATGNIVHLVSATKGEGASAIARDLAFTAATEGNQRTLLIDADVDVCNSAGFFKCPRQWGLLDCLGQQLNDRRPLRAVAGSQLSVGRLVGEIGSRSIDTERERALYELVRGRYDMTVVDFPPITGNRYGGLMPQSVDGIILVIEAEKLRPAVVAHAKELVQQAGGKILGSVLNRRKNYIPEFVYRRL